MLGATSRSDGDPPDGDARDRFLDDLRGPLTVIQASAQLLQRRLLRGGGLEPDKLLARLASVERAREVRRYLQYDPMPPV